MKNTNIIKLPIRHVCQRCQNDMSHSSNCMKAEVEGYAVFLSAYVEERGRAANFCRACLLSLSVQAKNNWKLI